MESTTLRMKEKWEERKVKTILLENTRILLEELVQLVIKWKLLYLNMEDLFLKVLLVEMDIPLLLQQSNKELKWIQA